MKQVKYLKDRNARPNIVMPWFIPSKLANSVFKTCIWTNRLTSSKIIGALIIFRQKFNANHSNMDERICEISLTEMHFFVDHRRWISLGLNLKIELVTLSKSLSKAHHVLDFLLLDKDVHRTQQEVVHFWMGVGTSFVFYLLWHLPDGTISKYIYLGTIQIVRPQPMKGNKYIAFTCWMFRMFQLHVTIHFWWFQWKIL